MICRAVMVWQPCNLYDKTTMKTNIRIGLFLLLGLMTISCSTSKKATTRSADVLVPTNAPDYERIKKEVNTKSSEFYYPELLRRFQAADTSLTAEHMYYFYYGTATRPDYNPYKLSNYDALQEALKKDNPEEKDWAKAAQVIDEQLETDPTNIRFHLYKHMVYSNLYGPESEKTIDAYNQVVMLLSAVTSTGDGSSKEKAFHVICVTDEYGIMDLFGLSLKMQSLVEDKGQAYDVMELEENKYGLATMYFNITVSIEAMNKTFDF